MANTAGGVAVEQDYTVDVAVVSTYRVTVTPSDAGAAAVEARK